MSSEMTPVNVSLPGAKNAAPSSRPQIRCFIRLLWLDYTSYHERTRTLKPSLPGNHQVSRRRSRIHDPDAALCRFVGQAERFRGRARDGNGQMQARMLPIRPAQVVPHRSERGLRAASALLLVGERRLRLGPIADGFGL